MLQRSKGYARSIDIARELGVSKPSVSVAMKNLRENGYIEMDPEGLLSLTDKGMEIAEKMLERHTSLSRFLIALGVDEETAYEDACKIEHDISEESFQAICAHIEKNGGLK